MKICAIISEYNPFHNGHAYLISQAKKESGCDALVCVMSGNFTQRGEPAVLEKHLRARHAVLAGADAVIELPAVFATAPAELFAKGAVHLLSAIPSFSCLAFGCESGTREDFASAASACAAESEKMRGAIREKLKKGMSLIRARHEAAAETGELPAPMLATPNNVLGVEYTKALLQEGCAADVLPVLRKGGAHADEKIGGALSSSTAIRAALREGRPRAVKKCVPGFVFEDLKCAPDLSRYKEIAVFSALTRPAAEMKRITDCTEGLENRIKALAKGNPEYDLLIEKTTTRRYISSRIRRILAASVLGIENALVQKSLKNKLYLNILAVNKERAGALLSELRHAGFPLLVRAGDENALSRAAAECYEKDRLAEDVYAFVTASPARGGRTLFV